MSKIAIEILTSIQVIFVLIAIWGLLSVLFSQQEVYDYILLDVIKGSALFIGGLLASMYAKIIKDKGAF